MERHRIIAQATPDESSQLVTSSSNRSGIIGFSSFNFGASQIPHNVQHIENPVPRPAAAPITEACGVDHPSSSTAPESNDLHRSEHFRLESFAMGHWPLDCPVSPIDLAAAGFYYVGTGDVVRCAYCRGTLKQWTPGDNAMTEHRKFFPNCPFVKGHSVGNVPLARAQDRRQSFPLEYREHLFPAQQTPLFEGFADVTIREQTFFGNIVPAGQTARGLAEAGFFYIGPEDNVKCYWCGGSLKSWQPADKPMSEHARWFPHCGLLRTSMPTPANQRTAHSGNLPVQNTHESFNQYRGHISDTASQSAGNVIPLSVEQAHTEDPVPMEIGEMSLDDKQPSGGLESLQAENQRLKDSITCKICMDANINTLFLPCGHLVCCDTCAPNLRQCPICRVDIRGSIRTYIS